MKTNFAANLARRMDECRKSDSHLVAALYDAGISVSEKTVRNWRLGVTQPRAADLRVISLALGCTPNDLLEIGK